MSTYDELITPEEAAVRFPPELDRINNVTRITAEEQVDGLCELCGKANEMVRPYGPAGENVCFACGMQDEAAAKRAFNARSNQGVN